MTARPSTESPVHDARLERLLECSGGGIYQIDVEGRCTLINKAGAEMLGYAAEELLGRNMHDVVHSRRLDGSRYPEKECPVQHAVTAGKATRTDDEVLWHKNGTSFPVDYTCNPVHEGERIIGAIVTFFDISDRKRAEAALRAEQLRLGEEKRVVETISRAGATLAAELDLQRLLQAITDAGTELSGAAFGAFFYNIINPQGESYTLHTLSGVPSEAFFGPSVPGSAQVVAPTFAGDGVVRLFDLTREPGYAKNSPFAGMREEHLPVRSYLAVPVQSRSGEVMGGLYFGHPEPGVFTEHHEAILAGVAAQAAVAIDNARLYQQMHHEVEERQRLLDRLQLTQSAAGICTWELNLEKQEATWSPEIALFLGPESRERPPEWPEFLEAVHPDDFRRFDAVLQRSIRRSQPMDFQFRIRHPENGTRWVHMKALVTDSQPRRLFGVMMDVTSQRRADEALRKAEKLAATGRLAATISHEINNPLEAVTNLLFLLRHHPGLDSTAVAYAEQAEQELARVADITRQTLGFYRDTSTPVPVNLAAIVDDVLTLYGGKFAHKRIQIVKQYSAQADVIAYRGEIRQVFANLVGNALDALPFGGTLSVKTEAARKRGRAGVCVSVEDNGAGIPQENLESIFEPFFTTKKDVGTGLGLWVVREIVEKHAGSIQVESNTEPDKSGTKFVVFLPESAGAAQPLATAADQLA